jgi:hypothetical protein
MSQVWLPRADPISSARADWFLGATGTPPPAGTKLHRTDCAIADETSIPPCRPLPRSAGRRSGGWTGDAWDSIGRRICDRYLPGARADQRRLLATRRRRVVRRLQRVGSAVLDRWRRIRRGIGFSVQRFLLGLLARRRSRSRGSSRARRFETIEQCKHGPCLRRCRRAAVRQRVGTKIRGAPPHCRGAIREVDGAAEATRPAMPDLPALAHGTRFWHGRF